MVSHDVQEHLSRIDRQIFKLLEERIALCEEAVKEDEEALGSEYSADTVGEWEAAADERGWNLNTMAKICRGVIELCKAGEE